MSSSCASAGPHGDVLALVQRAGPFARVPTETGKDVGVHTSLIILLKKGIYIEAPEHVCHLRPGSVDLKIGISNLAGASHFLSLLPLQPLHLCRHSTVSLAVECPSESGAPLSGEEGGDPPPPTVAHWDFGGLPRGHAAPVWGVSLASVLSPIPEVLPSCLGALPTSWLEESDSCAAPADVLWAEFSARLLSLWWSEAATDHCHASIKGRRLILKWAKHEIHSEKASSMWVRAVSMASCPKP